MSRYIIRRLAGLILIVIAATIVIFSILWFCPGDPAMIILGDGATEEQYAAMRTQLGIDKPFLVQLGTYLWSIFTRFDFGSSWTYGIPVLQGLMERLPRTLIIGAFSMLFHVLIGVPVGIYAALHASKWQDSLVMGLSIFLVSAPGFWVALLMVQLFSTQLGWVPAYGIDSWKCYILPIISGALSGIAVNARQMRSSMLEVIRSDFVTTARAKGQNERNIVWRHMLPNALMPIITTVSQGFAMIVAGSAVTENIFSIPGIGQYLLTGVNNRDYPIVRACVIFLAAFTALMMLVCDLAYAFVDPRIKAQYQRKG